MASFKQFEDSKEVEIEENETLPKNITQDNNLENNNKNTEEVLEKKPETAI